MSAPAGCVSGASLQSRRGGFARETARKRGGERISRATDNTPPVTLFVCLTVDFCSRLLGRSLSRVGSLDAPRAINANAASQIQNEVGKLENPDHLQR